MSEMTVSSWASGSPCERHDLAYCASCQELAKISRKSDGSVHYASDCAVQTFAELTGSSYEESVETLAAVGFKPGSGTPFDGLTKAFTAAGFKVVPIFGMTPETAQATGRDFFVTGVKGKRGHAWSITAGVTRRAYQAPYRYRVYEVVA